jgi:hypothetical protein
MDLHREDLQGRLETILGSSNVYFQPPENAQMQYPCIVYKRERADTEFAGNRPYHNEMRYQLMVIARDPDLTVVRTLMDHPKCLHIRFFTRQDLNHDVFMLVF